MYFSKSTDTAPSPLMTKGITTHSQSHIRPSSSLNPLYLVIFSCSFWATLMSLGQDMSIIKHFLFFLSLTTISGRLKTCGLSVEIGISHNISTSFSVMTSAGLWVCHLEHVWIWKLRHIAWWMYCATPLWLTMADCTYHQLVSSRCAVRAIL